jgi:hypothetical protein
LFHKFIFGLGPLAIFSVWLDFGGGSRPAIGYFGLVVSVLKRGKERHWFAVINSNTFFARSISKLTTG